MSYPGFVEFSCVWSEQQNQPVPPVHVTMARWLDDCWRQGERRLLLQAFRSAGKSSIVALFCAWLLGRDRDLRILVLAAEHALAVKMVRNVRRIVERHEFLRDCLQPEGGQWASDRFTVARRRELRDPSVLARGIGANITGSRADVVICDDVEVPNTCDTPDKRAELRERLAEIEFVLVPGGTQIYVGTPHSHDTIYAHTPPPGSTDRQAFLAGFRRLLLPLLDGTGASAWPDRYPPERIAEIRRRSGPRRFASQMLLQPVDIAAGRLDPGLLKRYDAELVYRESGGEAALHLMERRLVAATCWWDPAYGAPGRQPGSAAGDASVIAAVFADADGRSYLHRIAYLTHDPARCADEDEATQLCRQAAAFAEAVFAPAIAVETNGVGRFLPGLLRRALGRAGVPCAVVEVHARRAKDLRILEAFDAPLAAGMLHAHASVFDTPFIAEMQAWRPGVPGARDDGLDAVAGCLTLEPRRLPSVPPTARQRWRPGADGVVAPSDFEV
jgi:hypothetical protein